MNLESVLVFSAVVGSALFIVRMGMTMFGIASDHDVNSIDLEDGHHDGDATEGAFKLFTTQSFLAFLMIGGNVGLAAMKDFGTDTADTLFAALLGGLSGALLSSGLMYLMQKFNSKDKVKTLPGVGATGKTYTPVPMGGSPGLVVIDHEGRADEFLATSDTMLPSFTAIKVVGVKEKVLVVEALNP